MVPRRLTRPCLPLLLPLLLLGPAPALCQSPQLAVAPQGPPYPASFVEIDDDQNVWLQVAGARRRVPAEQLVYWGAYADNEVAPRVLLGDGSLLIADVLALDDAQLTIESAFWPATKIARRHVAGIVFAPPPEAARRDRLELTLASAAGTSDRLLLANGDTINGKLLADEPTPDSPAGLSRLRMQLRSGAQPVEVAVADVVAVVFNPLLAAARRPPPPSVSLGLSDGSWLNVKRVAAAGERVELVLAGGARLAVPARLLWDHVTLVQPRGAQLEYLSDQRPLAYQPLPFLDLSWPLGEDRSAPGGRLRSGGVVYAKGIGLHGAARVIYDLAPGYRTFAAELALDDRAGPQGSVVYRVFVEKPGADAAPAWQSGYESPVVRWGDPPLSMTVDVQGASRLALIVDFADRGDQGDHANWLNARLIK